MKRCIIFTLLALCISVSSSAKKRVVSTTTKTEVKREVTQARALNATSNAYVTPLKVELSVSPERVKDVWSFTSEEMEINLSGDFASLKNRAIYLSSSKYDADIIVAPLVSVKTKETTEKVESIKKKFMKLGNKKDKYLIEVEVEVVGYPAKYTNWGSVTEEDYKWINKETILTTDNKTKIDAIIQTTTKPSRKLPKDSPKK